MISRSFPIFPSPLPFLSHSILIPPHCPLSRTARHQTYQHNNIYSTQNPALWPSPKYFRSLFPQTRPFISKSCYIDSPTLPICSVPLDIKYTNKTTYNLHKLGPSCLHSQDSRFPSPLSDPTTSKSFYIFSSFCTAL